ncbi:hypothetical protein [Allofrancisella inopinata]|uniref:hypothetical protein n=1 Tax=Allofrancisella inopinata TaxID=1085647 RepID=UPI0014170017|nr:hypothetical protein [Allofrancisella inopinata]
MSYKDKSALRWYQTHKGKVGYDEYIEKRLRLLPRDNVLTSILQEKPLNKRSKSVF